MDEMPLNGSIRSNPRLIIGTIIFVLLMMVVIFLAISSRSTKATGILPRLATPTVASDNDSASVVQLNFSELNADPVTYLNRTIQVSGSYLPLAPPSCPRSSGPDLRWALVSEELQLEAKGYERIVQILAPGTEMAVQGIWSLYQGPLGCGKGPARGSLWYLQVQKIIQPNPLIGTGASSPVEIEFGDSGLPALLPTASPTITPIPTQAIVTEVPTATETPGAISPPNTPVAEATLTPIPTATFTSATPTAASTIETGGNAPDPLLTPSATSTADVNSTATSTSQSPPPATNTPSSGYPGPPSATPTATTDPYP